MSPFSQVFMTGQVDGLPVRESPVADLLRADGFQEGYKGLVLRSTPNRPR